MRDDRAECPDPVPDHCAVAACCSLLGDRSVMSTERKGERWCFSVRLKRAVSPSRPELDPASRAAGVKHGRRPPPKAARSVPWVKRPRAWLDRREHGARLEQDGTGWF